MKAKDSAANLGTKGWIYAIYCFLAYALAGILGSVWQLAGGFWNAAYGWDPVVILNMTAIGGIGNIIGSLIVARLVKKVSPRNMGITMGVVYVLALVVLCFTSSYGFTLAMIVVVTIAGNILGHCTNPLIIGTWFPKKKGFVMGFATLSIPLGSGITIFMLQWAYKVFGLQRMWIPYIIIGLVVLLLTIFYVRDYPEQRGLKPDNDPNMTMEQAKADAEMVRKIVANSPWKINRLFKCKEYWCLAITTLLYCIFGGGAMMTLLNALTDIGFTLEVASGMMLITGVVAAIGSFALGALDAAIGTKKAAIVTCALGVVGPLCLVFANGIMAVTYIALFLIGAVVGGASNFPVSLTVRFWGRQQFQAVLEYVQLFIMIGSAVCAVFMTTIAQLTPLGYLGSYIGLAIVMVIAIILLLCIRNENFARDKEAQFALEDGETETVQ